ncbi:MAG: hypothetical protein ACFFDX_03310, partial [Candidatus Odinarchaeota archaeon]
MSLIKKELTRLRISFSQIIKGFLLFVFSSSGLGVAIFLRYLGYGGTIIAFVGIIVELIGMTINYFLLKKYFKKKEEPKSVEDK